jgi:hypothetical protein
MSAANCGYFKVAIDGTGSPILGTMQQYEGPSIANTCAQAIVPNFQADKSKQLFPPSGDRFYYKMDRFNNILPNSMFSLHTSKGFPRCDDAGYSIIEFVITQCSNYPATPV